MSKQGKTLEELERAFLRRKAEIRGDESLSWEKRERQIKELSDQHYRARREMEAA